MSTATATKTIATLPASKRDRAGKGAARALRREGKIPAIVYNKKGEALSLSMPLKEVTLEYKRGRFRSRLIEIKLDSNESIQALPKELQFHPINDTIEHVDFLRVEKGVPIRVKVPVHFAGQDKSAGIKRGGVLNIVRHEIEFVCAPEAIPTHIDVDVQDMDIGDSVHINSIKLPEGVTPTIKRNFTVATVAGRSSSMSEEIKPAIVTVVEGEEAAEGAEGAAPAEGAAAVALAADAKKDDGKKDKK